MSNDIRSKSIYEKMHYMMENIQYLQKDDAIEYGNTKYRALSEEKVTMTIRPLLMECGLVVYPVTQTSRKEGNITTVDVTYRLVNVDNPEESIMLASSGQGADTQDKGVGKAMTYAFKYMWLRSLAIPTGEDADKISSEELTDRFKAEENIAAQMAQGEDTPITPSHVTALIAAAKKAGIEFDPMKAYGRERIEDMTEAEYGRALNALSKVKKGTK